MGFEPSNRPCRRQPTSPPRAGPARSRGSSALRRASPFAMWPGNQRATSRPSRGKLSRQAARPAAHRVRGDSLMAPRPGLRAALRTAPPTDLSAWPATQHKGSGTPRGRRGPRMRTALPRPAGGAQRAVLGLWTGKGTGAGTEGGAGDRGLGRGRGRGSVDPPGGLRAGLRARGAPAQFREFSGVVFIKLKIFVLP